MEIDNRQLRQTHLNDEGSWNETPEQRYERVVKWVRSQIKAAPER